MPSVKDRRATTTNPGLRRYDRTAYLRSWTIVSSHLRIDGVLDGDPTIRFGRKRGGLPAIAENGQFSTGNDFRHLSLDYGSAKAIIEVPRADIGFDHRQMQREIRLYVADPASSVVEKRPPNALPLQRGLDVEIIEEGAPRRFSVEEDADEAGEDAARHRFEDGAPMGIGLLHAGSPQLAALIEDWTVEEWVRQKTAVGAAPALRVQRRDVACVIRRGRKNRVVLYWCSG